MGNTVAEAGQTMDGNTETTETPADDPTDDVDQVNTAQPANERVKEILQAPQKKKDIDPHYIKHPMNFADSKGIGQIIRGLEGMFTELDFAVIDLFIGTLRTMFEWFVETGGDG